jgi:transposase
MSRKQRKHIRGKRGEAFLQIIRGVDRARILCVSLDISKYFHLVMMHNACGEIVTPSFEIDIFRSGFEHLCRVIDETAARMGAEVVLIGMEPTGHYFENIARHLHARYEHVYLINSLAVKENRGQKMMHHEKTDEEDAATIGDLLCRGEGTPYRPVEGIYLEMQHIDRVRIAKLKMRSALKNQVIGHLDRIFPGMIIPHKEAQQRHPPLFTTSFWSCQMAQDLVRVCPDPGRLSQMTPQELIDAFHEQGCRMGPHWAAKIIAFAQQTLHPNPEVIAVRSQLLPCARTGAARLGLAGAGRVPHRRAGRTPLHFVKPDPRSHLDPPQRCQLHPGRQPRGRHGQPRSLRLCRPGLPTLRPGQRAQ